MPPTGDSGAEVRRGAALALDRTEGLPCHPRWRDDLIDGHEVPFGQAHTTARLAVRGGILMVAGHALDALGTPVDVILTNLGSCVLVLPALTWRLPPPQGAAAAIMVASSIVLPEVYGSWDGAPVAEKFLSENYPAAAWTGYVLVVVRPWGALT